MGIRRLADMKKLFVFASIYVLLLTGVTAVFGGAAPAGVLPGDVNGDGVVDVEDLLLAIDHIFEVETLADERFLAADVNGDGVVDVEDLLMMVEIIFGGAELTPVPTAEVTPDVTAEPTPEPTPTRTMSPYYDYFNKDDTSFGFCYGDDCGYDRIRAFFKAGVGIEGHDYTPDDFPEIECVKVVDLFLEGINQEPFAFDLYIKDQTLEGAITATCALIDRGDMISLNFWIDVPFSGRWWRINGCYVKVSLLGRGDDFPWRI